MLAIVFFAFITLTSLASSDKVYVSPGDGECSGNNCDGSESAPYQSLEDGLEEVTDSDRIVMLKGTYTGSGNKNLIIELSDNDERKIQSDGGEVIIDCENNGFALNITRGTWKISDITIQNCGRFDKLYSAKTPTNGSALQISHTAITTLSGVIFKDNTAQEMGGAIYIISATVEIDDCEITGNYAGNYGGGVYLESASVRITGTTTIDNNESGLRGGGVYARNAALNITDTSSITENYGDDNGNDLYCRLAKVMLVGAESYLYEESDSKTNSKVLDSTSNRYVACNWCELFVVPSPGLKTDYCDDLQANVRSIFRFNWNILFIIDGILFVLMCLKWM